MKKGYLLSLLLVFSMFNGLDLQVLNAENEEEFTTIDVGKATTLEEKVDVALREIDLNIDLDNVVTSIILPTKGLYQSTITWTSSDSDYASISSGKATITRPAIGQEAKQVTLTAKVKIQENKDTFLEKERKFKITILPLAEEDKVDVTEEQLFSEDFGAYPVGEDVGEYISWRVSSNDPITKVVDTVPNNEVVNNHKALQINSVKTSKDIEYTRSFYTKEEIAIEAYVMFYGKINGIFFEFGRNDMFGPMFGLTHEDYYYYDNGDQKIKPENMPLSPIEGVWRKFRIEINPTTKKYSLKLYKLDGTNDVYEVVSNKIYSTTSSTHIDEFKIRIEGGDKVGQVYLSDIKIDYLNNFPISAGENPNREKGIGEVRNFQENILHINGNDSNYNTNIEVYNRFDETQLYTKGTDYTIDSSIVSSTDKKEVIKHTITLLETLEIKELIQTIYKEEANGLPYIEGFDSSHLARTVNSEGVLSSTGYINFKGHVTRDDGTIYYGLATQSIDNITADVVINGGSQFIDGGTGSFAQTTRDISFSIENLSLNNEYYLYVVIKNANGTSEVYVENAITEVINIATCEDFYNMTIDVTTYQNEFRLLNDLDFSNYNWVCDPSNTLKWEGVLDGQGYTIKNLKIESPYRKAAIFFEITDATIKNLNVDNCDVYGLQDSAIICGYSNGGTIENIKITNSTVNYNNNAGSEGYFAIIAGRLHKDTTNMTNIIIDKCKIDSNKYTGVLTGNTNKGAANNCVLNAKNIYADVEIYCDGAAIGLVGRNRGTTNLENCIAYIDIAFAKKEMAVVAGHNKEGGVLNVKNLIGTLEVEDCTQPTYFNNFIGSQDDSTSKYSFENVYFFKVDYSHLSDNLIPMNKTRPAGVTLNQGGVKNEQWWEENTFINCFETDAYWIYNSKTRKPELVFGKEIVVTSEMVNEHISQIKNDYSKNDHYHIYQALSIYEKLSSTEKEKVDYEKLLEAKENYDKFIASVKDII